MLISIFASIGSQNLGDELILKNEINILRQRYHNKNPNFIVFSYDSKNPFYVSDDVEYKEYFPVGSRNPKNIFRNLKNFFSFLIVVIKSDLLVIGGGGIIYDKEKQSTKSPLDSWLFRTNVFRFFKKKFSFFAVGISLSSESLSLQKVKKIFKGATSIEVRDDYSHELLENIGINSKVILDPVFSDAGKPKINRNLCLKKLDSRELSLKDLSGIDFAGKRIGLAFRRGYISKTDNPQMEILIIKEIIEHIQNSGGEIVLLPHSFHKHDILANDYEWMKLVLKKAKNIDITHNMQETYNVYKDKKIDLCLAERLHSIILSNVYEIPFVAISYSKKTNEILKEF